MNQVTQLITLHTNVLKDVLRDLSSTCSNSYTQCLKELKKKEEALEYSKYAQNYFKFTRENDWQRLCGCMDQLQDSLYVFDHFESQGLQTRGTKYHDGESIMRALGFLNAVYLHSEALILLSTIFSCQNNKKHKKALKSNKLVQVRHMLGSHTSNYLDKKTEEIETRFLCLHMSSKYTLAYGNHHSPSEGGEISGEHDLQELLKTYLETTLPIFYEICEKEIKTIFKKQKNFKEKYMNILKNIAPRPSPH